MSDGCIHSDLWVVRVLLGRIHHVLPDGKLAVVYSGQCRPGIDRCYVAYNRWIGRVQGHFDSRPRQGGKNRGYCGACNRCLGRGHR
ncbi:MAG: hypothetical protein R2857_11940 [Vampirovibrionales bacterium]